MGDLSGYIQTNLMSMTDGHIFFDLNIYNQGRRPAINPYLSVTRVGLQAQTPLIRDISRQLSSFLVKYDRLRQFLHFGAELSEAVRLQIDLGDKIFVFFDQQSQVVIPVNVSIFILGLLWSNHWRNADIPRLKTEIDKLVNLYLSNQAERSRIDGIITNEKDFEGLTKAIKTNDQFIHSLIT
jgi:F-type H+-transporting ATPase subunit alpha